MHVLGPFSLRHLSMFALIAFAFIKKPNISMKELSLPSYLFFIGIYAFCNLVNGEFGSEYFVRSLYTYHGPCIALIIGLPAIVKNKEHVKLFVWALIGLYLFDVVLSVLQFMNSSVAWTIALAINKTAEEGMENAEMYTNAAGGLIGYSVIAGIFGFVVTNGYFLATYLPVVTNKINSRKTKDVIIACILLLVCALAIFLSQQRMAFLSLAIYVLYFMYYGMNRRARIPIFVILLFISLAFIDFSSIDMGRLTTSHDDSDRMRLFSDFSTFIGTKDCLFGGAVHYLQTYGQAQHNTFLSAWVLGGVPTFVTYLFFYFSLLKKCIFTTLNLHPFRYEYPLAICFAISSAIFLIYSITHSAGVQSGSPLFWVVYVMMVISYKYEKEESIVSYL